MAKVQRSTDVKVGLFVALGILATFLSLFVIGQERKLWEKSVHLKARFSNVAGLKVGGQVRLSGISVGIVSKIELPELDEGADAAVVKPIDLATVPLPEGSALLNFPLELKTNDFPGAINIALRATDPDEKLEAAIEVVGVDFHGQKARERVLVRLRGDDGVGMGKIYFSKVESITLKVLKDAGVGSTIQVGDGTARMITVDMRVSAENLDRVRADSIAYVQTEGLFGDKFIDISMGSLSQPAVNDGDMLPSDEGVDIAAALASTGEIIDNVNASTESIRVLLDGFRKAGGEATIVTAMQSIQDIANEIEHGDGLIHQIIFDGRSGQQYKDIVANISASTKNVNEGLVKVDGILADVRNNKSLVHELLFGDTGEATIGDARKLIAEVTQIATDIRTNDSLVHNLLYDNDKGEIMTSLNASAADVQVITADVKAIVADVKRGKGTVGQLLNDPTVYEDLKLLLGNVRRNDAVKTLVRFAIEQKDNSSTAPPKPAE